ncbi:uncharacterized protein LOC143446684 isoform X2 [Clavelina lepadiformis]|uniref:uncharacterized protein LOC143446684 isoform X2 n=1 Tax=Clavelina lepadiformis TaxID=159417 RepID=UPI004040F70C
MKDTESVSPIMTPERLEHDDVHDEEPRERSRGRRRTAREIAHMFEQLKQRHMARKQEWQQEKEELLRQAAVGEDSKRILSDLKVILEDLRVELRSEENKRRNAEEEHIRGRKEWEAEEMRLIKIINNLEAQIRGDLKSDKHLADEIELLKSRLIDRERDLESYQKLNSEMQDQMRDQQQDFDKEKQNLMEKHEGERRNWTRARQVMLDKIESLTAQKNLSRSSSFPLHGSHIASPLSDDQSASVTSLVTSGRTSREDRNETENQSCAGSSTYNNFQRTVDQALKQIEKISQDLNTTEVEKTTEPPKKQLPAPGINPTLNKSPSPSTHTRTRSVSLDHSHMSRVRAGSGRFSHSPVDSDLRRSSASNYSGQHRKPTSREASSESSLPKSSQKKSRLASGVYAPSKAAAPGVESPLASSSNSCSLPMFTESGTDSSPSNLQGIHDGEVKSPVTKILSPPKQVKKRSFVKVEKCYRKLPEPTSIKQSVPAKKLPNLHQKLLFRESTKPVSSKISEKVSVATDAKIPDIVVKTDDTDPSMENKMLKLHTSYFSPNKGYVKGLGKTKPSPRPEAQTESLNQTKRQSPTAKNFVTEQSSSTPAAKTVDVNRSARGRDKNTSCHHDFVDPEVEQESFQNQEIEVPPPVRPKPSVTIEKDAKGNLLRVITDPRYQRQHSPSVERNAGQGKARRRSSGGNRDLSPLVPLTTVTHADVPKSSSVRTTESRGCEKPPGKESLGARGKSWIKKTLSFLDPPAKDVRELGKEESFTKHGKRETRSRSKNRSSSLRRGEERRKLLIVTSSDESDDTKSKEKPRWRDAKNDQNGKDFRSEGRSRTKKYSRSKTDNPREIKSLLLKFRSSHFNPKKPVVLRQFERKLLENEVRTLEDDGKELENGSKKHPAKADERMITKRKDCNEDDGYSGEDELDDHRKTEKSKEKKVVTKASVTLTRTPSIPSLQERNPLKVSSKPRHYKSLVDLRYSSCFKDAVEEEEFEKPSKAMQLSPIESLPESLPRRSPHQYIRTTLPAYKSQSSGGTSPGSASPDKRSPPVGLESGNHFVREAVSRLSLPPGSRREPKEKRLSWSSASPLVHVDGTAWRDTVISSASLNTGLKKSDLNGSTSASAETPEPPEKLSAYNLAPARSGGPRRFMSEEMKRKTANLERALRHEPNTLKSRRYVRSKTQPVHPLTSSSEENDGDDVSESRAMTRSTSMPPEEFSRELHVTVPGLTSRFKKPVLSNRRLPSRWKKNE